MTGAIQCRYYGCDFSVEEMALLRALIATEPQSNRAALSREFCRRMGWLKPDGGLKDVMARITMLATHQDGVTAPPPPRGRRNPPCPIVFGPDTKPPLDPAPTTVDEVRPLKMRPVVRKTRGQAFERVRRPLPLSRIQDPGRHPDALHRPPTKTVGHSPMLGFSTAAWKLARDEFIGWSPEVRERNLCRVIDNSCFPIMPWTRIPNLASHILSTVRSQLLQDCYMQYRVIPVLMETFVETPRFSGAVCRA